MSSSFSNQRHTPTAVPFEGGFSWQPEICADRLQALSAACQAADGCRNLDDSLQRRAPARVWLESEGRAYFFEHSGRLELLVRPDCRGRGWGTWLLQKASTGVECWAYGDHPASVAWMERHGFSSQRVLSMLRHPGGAPPPGGLPPGWRWETYEHGQAEAWHRLHCSLQSEPTRAWTRQRLDWQLQQRETPPAAFFLLWQASDLRGYLWLKQEEVFLWALSPECRGQGLGRWMLQWALAQGARRAFCDDTRPAARRLFLQCGFEEVSRDRCLRLCR